MFICCFTSYYIARSIYGKGAGQWGTNEEEFINLFTSHSYLELQQVNTVYDSTYNASLWEAITSEFSGVVRDALISLLNDPIDNYCRALKENTVDKLGTDETTVCRILGGNEKDVLQLISRRYQQIFDRNLVADIEAELSGDFADAVVQYISSTDITGGAELSKKPSLVVASFTPNPSRPKVSGVSGSSAVSKNEAAKPVAVAVVATKPKNEDKEKKKEEKAIRNEARRQKRENGEDASSSSDWSSDSDDDEETREARRAKRGKKGKKGKKGKRKGKNNEDDDDWD